MKSHAISLVAGLLIGVVYSLIGVVSPAPPAVALIGLLGILAGEQLIPLLKALFGKEPVLQCWMRQVRPHMFGKLAKGHGSQVMSDVQRAPVRDEKVG